MSFLTWRRKLKDQSGLGRRKINVHMAKNIFLIGYEYFTYTKNKEDGNLSLTSESYLHATPI